MRLYWKLFFWIAAALLLLVGTTSWLTHEWIAESREFNERLNILQQDGETAVELIESEGEETYHSWLHATSRTHNMRAVLLDEEGKGVPHGRIPVELQELVEQAISTNEAIHISEPPVLTVIQPIFHEDERFTWIAVAHLPPELAQKTFYQTWWIRVGASLLIIALVSFLLSRIITRPIQRLQLTAHRLGRGDLAARALPEIGHRTDEIGELAEKFDTMAEQIEQLVTSQKQLLRDVSHEIRSPLARMQLALELALQKSGSNEDELSRIRREAERIDQLIGDLLALIRLENDPGQTSEEELSPATLLEEIVRDAAFEASQHGKHVNLQVEADRLLIAQPQLLQSALENIVRNAIRHTSENGIVEVTQHIDNDTLKITVSDQGSGVPESALQHLFEPFYRVDDARDRQSGGFGIGLAIAARAIHAHHGTITASNRPAGGLEVCIHLPFSPSEQVTTQQH